MIRPEPAKAKPRRHWFPLVLLAIPLLLIPALACTGLAWLLHWPGSDAPPKAGLSTPKAAPYSFRPVRKFEGDGMAVVGLAFRPDGKRLFSATGPWVRTWDADSGTPFDSIKHKKQVTAIALAPGGKMLAVATQDRVVHLRNFDPEEARGGFGPLKYEVVSMAVSPDGKLLALGTAGDLQVWDVSATPERKFVYLKAQLHVSGVAFSGDGQAMAWVNYQREVHVVDTNTWEPLHEALEQSGELTCVAFTADGTGIVYGGRDAADPARGVLLHWDLTTAGAKPRPLSSGKGVVLTLALLPDTRYLIHGGAAGESLHLLDPNDNSSWPAATVGESALQSLAVSPNGRLVAGGMANGTIQLWEVVPAVKGP